MAGTNSRHRKEYRDAMQKVGVTISNQAFASVPQKANPVTTTKPSLGAKQKAHPFKASKTSI